MGLFLKVRERVQRFLHDEELKRKLYVIIFESDTRMGKLFDTCLIGFIIASVLIVILESMRSFAPHYTLALRILEYIFTAFFTFEYLVRIYCSPHPKKYIFSFFLSIVILRLSLFQIHLNVLRASHAFPMPVSPVTHGKSLRRNHDIHTLYRSVFLY